MNRVVLSTVISIIISMTMITCLYSPDYISEYPLSDACKSDFDSALLGNRSSSPDYRRESSCMYSMASLAYAEFETEWL